jgi:hypothetical protein
MVSGGGRGTIGTILCGNVNSPDYLLELPRRFFVYTSFGGEGRGLALTALFISRTDFFEERVENY